MRLNVEAVKANDPVHSREIYELCSHIAGVTARKNHAHEFADDMAQDLALIVLTRLPEIYDGESEIDAWVWEAARRMTKGYKRRARREISGEGDEEGEGLVARTADEVSPTAEAWAQGLVASEEAAIAKAELIASITERAKEREAAAQRKAELERQQRKATVKKCEAGEAAAAEKPWFIDRTLRPRREGWEVRRKLGLTQTQISALLGVSVNRYREYEKAGKMPAGLEMKGLVLLAKNRELPDSDGPKLVKRWLAALGLQDDDTTTLARRIGVHRATVYRWATGKSHPQGAAIMHIEAMIEAMRQVTQERAATAKEAAEAEIEKTKKRAAAKKAAAKKKAAERRKAKAKKEGAKKKAAAKKSTSRKAKPATKRRSEPMQAVAT